jgi:hypothetical protein
MVEELRMGKPNYDLMSPDPADVARQQLPGLHGWLDYRVWLRPDGKVNSANVRPSQ